MTDITLTFSAIGTDKVIAEVEKIKAAFAEISKGFSTGAVEVLTSAAKEAAAAAESLGKNLKAAAEAVKSVQKVMAGSAEAAQDLADKTAKAAGVSEDLADKLDEAADAMETLADSGAEEAAEELDELDEEADDASESLEKLERSSGKAKAGFLGFNAAAVGIGAALAAAMVAIKASKAAFDMLVDGVMNAFKAGQEFSKMAAALGMDAGSARVLAQAFTEAGMSAQSVVPMVSKMQRKIAEGSAAFEALGMDVEALKGKTAIEQLEAIGDAVRGVTDQEGRMKVLMAIFEEAGPQLSKLFNNPDAIKNATATLGSSVRIMKENAEAFDRAAVLISNISTKIGTFFEGVAAGVVGPLSSLLEALNGIDLASIGEKFGKAIRDTAEVFHKAFLNDAFFALLQAKFSAAATSFLKDVREVWAPVQDAFNGVAAGSISAIEATAAKLDQWMTPEGWSPDRMAIQGGSWVDLWKQYNKENLQSAQGASGAVGDWLERRHNEWKRLEEQLMRSLEFKDLSSSTGTDKRGLSNSDIKLDLSGLLKKLAGGLSSFTPQTDALQRIGGSIGGMSGAQLAPARKTADNTSRLVTLTNQIRSTLATKQSSSVAVYA